MAARPFRALIERKVGQIDAKYADVLVAGFATAPFDGEPEPESLQCRNDHDRTNWIGLLLQCQAASALGMGGELIAEPGLRCTSNRMYRPTYDDTQGRLWALFGQAASAQANWWRLKDETRAVSRREDLELIDLDAGWP